MHDTDECRPDERRRVWRFRSRDQPGSTQAIEAARAWLLARQHAAGFWCGELEGDTTLESYMILLEAFLGRREATSRLRLARTIRDEALPGGGWSQYPGGPADLSVSCLSYFALKVAGDDADAPHMQRRARRDPRAWAARIGPTRTRGTTWRCSANTRGTRCPRSRPR